MDGWIKLHRRILQWEWFSDPNVLSVYMYLLLQSNRTDATWRGLLIKQGQHMTSAEKIAAATGLTRQKVRTALGKLLSTNEITIESTNERSLVTIVNWAVYQHCGEDNNQRFNQRPNQPATNDSTNDLTNQQPTSTPTASMHSVATTPGSNQQSNQQPNHKQEDKKIRKQEIKTLGDFHEKIEKSNLQDGVKSVLLDWVEYKKERKESYKDIGLKKLIAEVENKCNEHGCDSVIGQMNRAMANGWRGMNLDKIEKKADSVESGINYKALFTGG